MNNTELVASIKILGGIPENQGQFSPASILNLATEEMSERMLPFLIVLSTGLYNYDFTIPIVVGTQKYFISPRAAFMSIRDIKLIGSTTNINLLPIDPTRALKSSAGPINGYYFQQSKIVLDRIPAQAATLGYSARIKPSSLTETSYSSQVTAFNAALKTITLSSVPTAFIAGYNLDTIKSTSGHDLIDIDNPIASIATLTLTMTNALSLDIAVGDWLSPAGTSPVPQMSDELHSTLSLMCASRCLLTLGQLDQKKALDERINENLKMFKVVMWPRGRGETEIATSPYFTF